jgi:hypothetical protein
MDREEVSVTGKRSAKSSPSVMSFVPPQYVIHPILRFRFVPASVLLRSFFGCSSLRLRFLYKRRITEEQPKKQRICPGAGTKQSRSAFEETIYNNLIGKLLVVFIAVFWQNWMLLEVKKSLHRAHEERLFTEKMMI